MALPTIPATPPATDNTPVSEPSASPMSVSLSPISPAACFPNNGAVVEGRLKYRRNRPPASLGRSSPW